MSRSLMTDKSYLDKNFSTTQLLAKEKPAIENHPEDKLHSVLFLPENPERKGEGGLRTKEYFKKSYEDKPLISIVTVVYNDEKYLEQTILSVIKQTYDNIEYIIIDGGSSDGTMDIVRKYEDQIDYWVSERDAGIYDAMNKGLKLSLGEVIGIINADDFYKYDTVYKSIHSLQENSADYSIGNIRKIPSKIVAKTIFPLIEDHIYQEMMYPHISAFIAKDVYKKVGLFDISYKISADFDMALRIHLQNFRAVYVDMVMATVSEGGVSGDISSKKEYLNIVITHGKNPVLAHATYSLHLLKYYLIQLLPNSIIAKILKVRKSRFQYEN